MYYRAFNSIMGQLNELWTANVLGMNMNHHTGIDLIGKDKQVEVKFTLQYPNRYRHKSWRVLDHELEFGNNGKPAFWGLGFYILTDEIANIHVRTQLALEKRVVKRELFIVPWNWMHQYPRFHHIGRTQLSSWNHWLRFPKAKNLPPTTATYNVEKGIINLTKGVDEELFKLSR